MDKIEILANKVNKIATAGLLDGEPYDDVKEYIDTLEAEIHKYKPHSIAISKLNSCNDCAISKSCSVHPGWGAYVRINCHLWESLV